MSESDYGLCDDYCSGILWHLLGRVSDMIDFDRKGRVYQMSIDVFGCVFCVTSLVCGHLEMYMVWDRLWVLI